jgi:hypothetical protein
VFDAGADLIVGLEGFGVGSDGGMVGEIADAARDGGCSGMNIVVPASTNAAPDEAVEAGGFDVSGMSEATKGMVAGVSAPAFGVGSSSVEARNSRS